VLDRRSISLLGLASLLGLSLCGGAPAAAGGASRKAEVAAAVKHVQGELGDGRIVGARLTGTTLLVTLVASGRSPSLAIAQWDAEVLTLEVNRVLAAARLQVATGARYVNRKGFHLGDRRIEPIGIAPAVPAIPAGTCEREGARAPALGAAVVEARTVAIGNGACVIVVRPTDIPGFVANGQAVGAILAGLSDPNSHARVFEVVDGNGALQFVLGSAPSVGGGELQGFSGARPGLTASWSHL
jgi:hypothetical protein